MALRPDGGGFLSFCPLQSLLSSRWFIFHFPILSQSCQLCTFIFFCLPSLPSNRHPVKTDKAAAGTDLNQILYFDSCLFLSKLFLYLTLFCSDFLCTNFTTSMIGTISIARPRAIRYSGSAIGVNSNAFARNGTSITAVVRIKDTIIAP